MKCPCFYPEVDPEAVVDEELPELQVCNCGHVIDEHDEEGECQAEVEDWGPESSTGSMASGHSGGSVSAHGVSALRPTTTDAGSITETHDQPAGTGWCAPSP